MWRVLTQYILECFLHLYPDGVPVLRQDKNFNFIRDLLSIIHSSVKSLLLVFSGMSIWMFPWPVIDQDWDGHRSSGKGTRQWGSGVKGILHKASLRMSLDFVFLLFAE